MSHPMLYPTCRSRAAGLLLLGQCLFWLSCKTNEMIAVRETQTPCLMLGEPSTKGDCCSESSVDGKCKALEFCTSVGGPCTVAAQCCSGYCDGTSSTCTPTPDWPQCRVEGERCDKNGHCCSGACSNSTVADPTLQALSHCQPLDGCKPVGERCRLSNECCSERCVANPTSYVARCQLSCKPPDEPCRTPEECCSQSCNPAGRCDRGTSAFLPKGEVCGAMGLRCNVPDPSTATMKTDCVETKEGVMRCRNFDAARTFEQEGTLCETASECCAANSTYCAWLCLPPAQGTLTGPECTQSCVALGGNCLSAADCCTDAGPVTCHLGQCHLTGLTCAQLGQPCTASADCCSRNCATTTGPFPGTYCAVPDDPPP